MKIKVHLTPAPQHELIKCKNSECGSKYILYGIIIGEEENGIGVYPLTGSNYCPYCGSKQYDISIEVINDR